MQNKNIKKIKGRTLCVGDIHGALKALLQCLERADVKPEDKLIFLGDYVDGWSESAEVVDHLIQLSKTNECIFLRGNHDEWCSNWLNKGQSMNVWISNGGKSTQDSYINTGLLVCNDHKKFFRTLHNYYIDDQNRGFVHGGFISRKGLGHEMYQADYYWDRDLWQLALMSDGRIHTNSDGTPHGKRMYKHKEVFIGHTATINWNNKPHYKEFDGRTNPITVPMNRCNVWNMDTGAGFTGKLTIMDIDTKQYWQSDFVHDLYSDEKGR